MAGAHYAPRLLSVNFLEICQRLAQEVGTPNGAADITATAGQTGEAKRIVDWAQTSWMGIAGKAKWNWLWERPTLTMALNTSTLAATLDPSRYDKEGCYLPVSGQMGSFPSYLPWDMFRFQYPMVQPGPSFGVWTVAPDGSIRVDQQVTAATDFIVERWKTPTELSGDTDIPEMPVHLHMLIVWNAVVLYASHDEAGVQRMTAVEEFNRLDGQHSELCLPEMRLGGPLGGL